MHKVAQQGFGAQVQAYESARPSFPTAALTQILSLLQPGSQILDIGAGTGKFTRLIAAKCGTVNVQAVEPVQQMREVFQQVVPGVKIQEGHADNLPLPDSAVDCITCAQVCHLLGSLKQAESICAWPGIHWMNCLQ